MCAGGGYEAAVTGRTRCMWIEFREFYELLYGNRFPLGLNGAVCESYLRPEILHGSDSLFMKESEMEIVARTVRFMVTATHGV